MAQNILVGRNMHSSALRARRRKTLSLGLQGPLPLLPQIWPVNEFLSIILIHIPLLNITFTIASLVVVNFSFQVSLSASLKMWLHLISNTTGLSTSKCHSMSLYYLWFHWLLYISHWYCCHYFNKRTVFIFTCCRSVKSLISTRKSTTCQKFYVTCISLEHSVFCQLCLWW